MQTARHGDADVAAFALPPNVAGAHVWPDALAMVAAATPSGVTHRCLAQVFGTGPTNITGHPARRVTGVSTLVVLKRKM